MWYLLSSCLSLGRALKGSVLARHRAISIVREDIDFTLLGLKLFRLHCLGRVS